jgi:hypothetical protein
MEVPAMFVAAALLRFGGAVKQEFLDGRAVLQDQVYIRALAVRLLRQPPQTPSTAGPERTLAEVQGWEDLSPDGKKNDRGLEIFAQLPAPTPGEPIERTPVPPRTQRRRRRPSGSSSTPEPEAAHVRSGRSAPRDCER